MTNEYKENLLAELVGQIQDTEGVDEPQIQYGGVKNSTLDDYIRNHGHTNNLTLAFSVSRNNRLVLFYNEYTDHFISAFVVITDNNLEPLGIINSSYGGTLFSAFQMTSANDSGEGRIYFVSNNRIYYINDPTSKKPLEEYNIRILASYPLQLNGGSLLTFKKYADGGNFVFAYRRGTGRIGITEFVNNVGAPSEWNTYEYDFNEIYFTGSLDIFPIWDNGFECRVCYITSVEDSMSVYDVMKVLITNDNVGTLSLQVYKIIPVDADLQTTQTTMITYNKVAYIVSGLSNHKFLHITDISTEQDTMVYEFVNSTPVFKVLNNMLFIKEEIPSGSDYNIYCGVVIDDTYYRQTMYVSNVQTQFFVFNMYNLYTFLVYEVSRIKKAYLIYNENNYNGQPYNSDKSTVSNSAVLYNSNSEPIFARNLYNKTTYNNTESSTVNVPNFQLNDTTISNESLISMANNEIVSSDLEITKNIYENLFINFFNTINITDNNFDKNQANTIGASYFVSGINNLSYDDIKATKFKVTYTDETTFTGDITDISLNGTTANLVFCIYVDKPINKIEIISNDTTTSYAEIGNQSYDLNSIYKITQQVVIA